jgi:predicted RNA-binding Zn-ribbon protein involved in translation (DUF1610 family)
LKLEDVDDVVLKNMLNAMFVESFDEVVDRLFPEGLEIDKTITVVFHCPMCATDVRVKRLTVDLRGSSKYIKCPECKKGDAYAKSIVSDREAYKKVFDGYFDSL